jgi:enterochelin esterase-like enzyme
MNSEFQPPPKGWSILATVGGVATAIAIIVGLESLSSYSHKANSLASTSASTTASNPDLTRTLDQQVEQQAAACKFNQSMVPDRGIRFETKTFSSQAMGQTRSYGLVLPPGYEQNPQKLYPVIFLLHGGHGDAGGWQSCAAVTEILHKLYANGKLPPAIVITPDGNDQRGSSAKWDPDYFDGPNGKIATLIGSDLVQEVKSRYRVLNNADFWAIGGLSSGGWGAFNIGLRYLDQFHILFSHSGYFTDASGSANSPEKFIQQIPSERLRQINAYLDVGASDEQFLTSTDQFHRTLKQLGVEHEFHMFSGGHGIVGQNSGWHYWHEHLTDSLSYIGERWIGYNSPSKPAIVDIASLDAQSVKSLNKLAPQQLPDAKPQTVSAMGTLNAQETVMARQAWQYFQRNWNDKTGLTNAADGFASVTLWDQAAAIAALVSARELDLITATEFNTKMSRMLKTLATLPLYKDELPNKVYNAKTLMLVGYGQLDKREDIGWSALDLGRMALWLRIVGSRYPALQAQTEAVWQHWKVGRLVKAGQLYGTAIAQGNEQYNQEGRLGYESYAAYGLSLWGLNVKQALDTRSQVAFVNLYGQDIPYDRRDFKTSGANNYVLSEPYILDGIETGFQALPKAYADQILAAQEARYQATKQLTALTEDNLDRAPYFVYNTLFVNGEAWATITDTQLNRNNLRFLSTKAAIGWHVLYNSAYTQQLFNFVQSNLKAKGGWYNGFYESLKQPNQSLTANNNGVILESLLYKKVGQPLTRWAGVQSPPISSN